MLVKALGGAESRGAFAGAELRARWVARLMPIARSAPFWIASFALGGMGGAAISGGLLSIMFPLGLTSSRFAMLDDRVTPAIQDVLADSTSLIWSRPLAGGTVGVAISYEQSKAVVAFSSVRPDTADGAGQQVAVLVSCGEDMVNLGTMGDAYFDGARGEGWENGFVISSPAACTSLAVAVLDSKGDVVEIAIVQFREVTSPIGELASGTSQ